MVQDPIRGEARRSTHKLVEIDKQLRPSSCPTKVREQGPPVDDRDYQVPFTFTGKLLRISVEPPKLTPEDERSCGDAQRAAQDAK